MGPLQGGQVEIGEQVPVEDQEPLVQQPGLRGQADRACGPERLFLLDVDDRRTAGDRVAERLPQVLGPKAAGHDHLVDPVAADPVDQIADERAIDERQRRLRLGQRQRSQPGPLSPDEHQGSHQLETRPTVVGVQRPIPS